MKPASNHSLSIVVVSNPLSAVMANTILFDQTKAEYNVLIIDFGAKKSSFLEEIHTCIKKKPWTIIVDLSHEINDNNNSKPGLRKRLTRKYKSLPIVKSIYTLLQKNYLNKIESEIEFKLRKELNAYFELEQVNLFLLTQTYANNVLLNLFPSAKLNYYEHGIGDYVLSAKLLNSNNSKFYGIFADEFKKFNPNSPLTYVNVEFNQENQDKNKTTTSNRNHTLIILQNLEIYNLGIDFWQTYLTDIVRNEKNSEHFYIKPHPLQSNEIIKFIAQFFSEKGISYSMLVSAKSIELEFDKLATCLNAVYSPFSSSVFYLSKIYSKEEITFYESINRIKEAIGKAPAQYKNHFLENFNLVKKVFGSNCKEF
jgi:hypothetical protein